MDRISQLDAIIELFDLNKHPFYQEWRMGTLPEEKLKSYAVEYQAFVGTIAAGWDTVGEPKYGEEERYHELLWTKFKSELGASGTASLKSTDTLVTASTNLFEQPVEALGALYAFEAQQPHTSKSKLDGLLEHYTISEEGREYFRVHADDFAEAELIRERVKALSDEEFGRVKTACAIVCSSMWGALDGIYYARETVNA
jgi:pyrroloquinoline-quinone synthase